MKTHFKELNPAGIFIGIVIGITLMIMVSFSKSESSSSSTSSCSPPASAEIYCKVGTATVYRINNTSIFVVVGVNGDVAIR